MGTHYPAQTDIKHDWLLVDLNGQTVGRAATRIASILRGKHKVTFTPHLDTGDFVVCINADKVKFSGNKIDAQTYHKDTGYLGHLKTRTAREMLARSPEVVIKSAVKRMLPKNPLGRKTFSKLKVYAGPDHPHTAQNPKPYEIG